VWYVILFLSLLSSMQADAMGLGGALPVAPQVPAGTLIVKNVRKPAGTNDVVYPVCAGIVYEEPTLEELQGSRVGQAIESGDIVPVKSMFDGPSGWRYLIYRLFIDQEKLWVPAVHGLVIAVSKPHQKTGSVAEYLWKKVEKGYKNGKQVDEMRSSQLESRGACLILNAYQNGHHQILGKMLKWPFMQYGICESLRQAVQADNIDMYNYFSAQGVQCNGDVLLEAIKMGREVPAFWLIKNKIGLSYCDQYDGSPLHAAILRNSLLLPRLILETPVKKLSCHMTYSVFSKSQGKRIHKATPLNWLFDQVPLDEKNIDLLVQRGGNVAPGSSDKHRELLARYRQKFGLEVDTVCHHDAQGKKLECFPLKRLGW